MASVIVVVIIFVLLALAILYLPERRLAGRLRRQLRRLPQQMRREREEKEVTHL